MVAFCRMDHWQGDQEVHHCSYGKQSNGCKHYEASPDDQLGSGETIASRLLDHVSSLPLSVSIMAVCADRHVSVHWLRESITVVYSLLDYRVIL